MIKDNTKIEFDLERTPLQIKTIQGGDVITVFLYDESGDRAGRIFLTDLASPSSSHSPQRYQIYDCVTRHFFVVVSHCKHNEELFYYEVLFSAINPHDCNALIIHMSFIFTVSRYSLTILNRRTQKLKRKLLHSLIILYSSDRFLSLSIRRAISRYSCISCLLSFKGITFKYVHLHTHP